MINRLCAFTKPWPNIGCCELAEKLSNFGFDGVELCVRKGYQVFSEDNQEKRLAESVSIFNSFGIDVVGSSSCLDEVTIAASAAAGFGYIRTLLSLPPVIKDIDEEISDLKRNIERTALLAEKHNIVIGLQEHTNSYLRNSIMLHEFVRSLDSDYIKAIWDSAHSVKAGESETFGLQFILPDCCSVQLKNIRFDNPGVSFVPYDEGIIDWAGILEILMKNNYRKGIVLTHEYSDSANVDSCLEKDVKFVRSIMGRLEANE